jgi:hypothetical protein
MVCHEMLKHFKNHVWCTLAPGASAGEYCEEQSDEAISYLMVPGDCHAALVLLETAARNDIIVMNNTN